MKQYMAFEFYGEICTIMTIKMKFVNSARSISDELEMSLSSLESSMYNKQARTSEKIPFEALALAIKENKITELKYWLLSKNLGLIDSETGITLLHVAICWSDSSILQLLLENPQCSKLINTSDKNGFTPLIYAVQYESLDMVQKLCSLGAKTGNTVYKTKETALHYAVKIPNINILTYLLSYNSSSKFVDATNIRGDTALIIAARDNSPAVVPLLLARADYMKGNTVTKRTILHEAVAFSHENLVQEIFEHCSSLVFTDLPDKRGDTAFMLAVKLNNLNLVKLFINLKKTGLFINTYKRESVLHMAVTNDKYEILEYLLANTDEELLKMTNHCGMTPLLIAGELGSLKCLKLLMTKGNFYIKNALTGNTLLHVAVKSSNVSVLSELTMMKSLHWFIKQKDNNGKTPFWLAVEGGHHLSIISLLTAGWIDSNELNENGESYLFVSAKHGYLKVLKTLLLSDKYYAFCKNYSTQVNINDINILSHAEIRGEIYSSDLFILFGQIPKPNTVTWIPQSLFNYSKKGENIFHACALGGNIDCIKFMHTYFKTLKLDLKLFDEKSNNGDTPLMVATESRFDHNDCVCFFLENCADIISTNNKNMTVLQSIFLLSPKPTNILIKAFNSFITKDTSNTMGIENEVVFVNFAIVNPNGHPQITAIKLLDKLLQGKHRNQMMQHPIIKMFINFKWVTVKKLFIMSFIVTCISTFVLTSYLTFTVVKSNITETLTIVKPLLVILNVQEIILSVPLLSTKEVLFLFYMIVLVLLPCSSTIYYVLFNDGSQTMREIAAVCVLMSWLRLLMFSANIFEEISLQVAMLSKVLLGLCRYFLILFIIILAFSMCFFCAFNDYNEFGNPILSLMYTFFVMLQGELEGSFDYFLNKHYFITTDIIDTNATSTIINTNNNTFGTFLIKNVNLLIESSILLLFLFICIIGLLNMLVSLVVRDGHTLDADGEVFQRHLQIYLLHHLEMFLGSKVYTVLEKTGLIYLLGISPKMKKVFNEKLTFCHTTEIK